MQFATTLLNLAWAVAGLIALAFATWAALSTKKAAGMRWITILSVALVVSSLFPYISASDDIVRIEHYQAERNGNPAKSGSDGVLVHLYEALETLVSHTLPGVCLTLFFFAFVVAAVCLPVRRNATRASGRSPPAFAPIS